MNMTQLTSTLYFRATIAWFGLMFAETCQGILRTWLLQPRWGEQLARQIAFPWATMVILSLCYMMLPWIAAHQQWRLFAKTQWLRVGFLWVTLTLTFEIAIGYFALSDERRSVWDLLKQDYDLSRGGLMSIGLLVMGLAPLMIARVRERRDRRVDELLSKTR